jgi:hypothetical protein
MKCWIDLEHRKVSAPSPWNTRRQVFLVGIAFFDPDLMVEVVSAHSEEKLFEMLADAEYGLARYSEIAFMGRRAFDQMCLLGRMYHGRRGFLDVPGPWPHLEDKWTWERLPVPANRMARINDVNHRDVALLWDPNGGSYDRPAVVKACMRDVVEAVLVDPTSPIGDDRPMWEHYVATGDDADLPYGSLCWVSN